MTPARSLLAALLAVSAAGCMEVNPHPYVTTAELTEFCTTDRSAVPIRKVHDSVCFAYLNAVVDAVRTRAVHPADQGVCFPSADAMWQDRVAVFDKDEELRKALAASHHRLPLLVEVHGLFMRMQTQTEGDVEIPLHETPYEVVIASLAEAWPCTRGAWKQPGYRLLYGAPESKAGHEH